jgi:hypothetical protein
MRLRTLLATAVVGTLIAGVTGMTAQAMPVPSPARAGTVVTWGNAANVQAAAAMAVPTDLTAPVAAMAATSRSAAAVTTDGQLRVWGGASDLEVTDAPTDVTDAVAVALAPAAGLVLRRDGKVTGWGSLFEVPDGLLAKAVAIGQDGKIAYAVRTDGTLARWGDADYLAGVPVPESGLTDLVDVSAAQMQVLAQRADGTVVAWGLSPAFGQASVPDFGDRTVEQVVSGQNANGVVLDDGTIRVWGQAVPASPPDFEGTTGGADETVRSLSLGASNAGAVTEDGAVHTWGSNVPINTHPETLTGKPTASVVLGSQYAAAIVTTYRELSAPTVAGTPQVGQTLTATPATLSLAPDSPATGQWFAGADAIAGQTGTTLALTQAMVGKKISYQSTATRGEETITSTSNEVGPVTLVASATMLTVSPATGAYGVARTATATVTKTGGTPTGTVTFKVGSTESTATLTAGKATWALPTTLAVGAQTVTASYQGDATTAASTSAAASVTVSKAASKVTAKGKAKGKTKKFAKKVTVTVTVKSAKGVSPSGKVTVALKGKTKKKVTVKVNAQGRATATFKKVKHGKYKAAVTYAGNTNVASAKTSTKKFKA